MSVHLYQLATTIFKLFATEVSRQLAEPAFANILGQLQEALTLDKWDCGVVAPFQAVGPSAIALLKQFFADAKQLTTRPGFATMLGPSLQELVQASGVGESKYAPIDYSDLATITASCEFITSAVTTRTIWIAW